MYESAESKDFKKHYGIYLKQLVKNTDWDIEQTKEGHWYLDCVFVQSRLNQDSSNFFKIMLDSMKGIVFDDDKNILVRVQKVVYNPKNPRFIATLRPVKYVGMFNTQEGFDSFEEACVSCSKYRNGKCSILRDIKDNKEVDDIRVQGKEIICNSYKQRKNP